MSPRSCYRSPEILLEELGITEPEEIDIEAIAEYCGATILYERLEGCEARLLGYHDRAIITINPLSSRERQRFSGGHELGHWMCDRGKIAFACMENVFHSEWGGDNPERRANRFGADLLLPGFLFIPRAYKREITFTTVREFASQFETSLTATAIRLVELGSFPALVICDDTEGRRWFIRGPSVPERLWPHEMPGKDTIAHDLLRGGSWDKGPLDVYASQWFTYPGAHQHAVREDSIRIGPGLVLTLLWWKDERPLIELDELDES